MITILHGDNLVASRKIFNQKIEEAKNKGVKEVIRLDGKKVELVDLKQALETQSLFGGEKLIVIEDLLARVKSGVKKDLIDYIRGLKGFTGPILWERKGLTKSQLKAFGNATVLEFKTPVVVFKFLDAVRPNNPKQLVSLYEECLKSESAETVFYMFSRQIRMLLQSLSEETKLPAWQISKLRDQLNNLGEEKVLALHKKLLEIDGQIKTGKSSLGLAGELDLVIAKI